MQIEGSFSGLFKLKMVFESAFFAIYWPIYRQSDALRFLFGVKMDYLAIIRLDKLLLDATVSNLSFCLCIKSQ